MISANEDLRAGDHCLRVRETLTIVDRAFLIHDGHVILQGT